jgi:hypothetical protein
MSGTDKPIRACSTCRYRTGCGWCGFTQDSIMIERKYGQCGPEGELWSPALGWWEKLRQIFFG